MYLEHVNDNNVNIYILYTCYIVFILCISTSIILTFVLSNNIHYYLLNGKFPNIYGKKNYEIDVDNIFNKLTI